MKRILAGFALIALLAWPLAARADDAKPQAAGTVISLSGKVTLTSAKGSQGSLKLGQALFPGDRIQTGANGRAQLVLEDGTQLKVNYLTDITLKDKDSKGKASPRGIAMITVALGDLWAKVTKKDSRLEFETPAAVAAVKGTELGLGVKENGDLCAQLAEGKIVLTAGDCEAALKAHEQLCKTKLQKACEATILPFNTQPGWVQQFSGPTSAVVTLHVKDSSGNKQDIQVQYQKKP
jgi:hypothetical protein